MSGDLCPYPEYAEPAVFELGSIPSHWEERRAKFYMREVDERSRSGAEAQLSVSHLTGVRPRRHKNVTMVAASYAGHKLCHPGDVVVNTMWAWMAALGVSPETGLVSPSYGVYRLRAPQTFDPVYLDRLLRLPAYAYEYRVNSTGVTSSRLRLYADKFLNIALVRPPIEEQRAIVKHVWHVEREVGAAIRAKQRMISLLTELKRVTVQQVIFGGLGQASQLSAGSIDPQDLPDSWDAPPLKAVASIQSGITLGKDYSGKKVYEYPYLRVANVQAGRLSLDSVSTIHIPKSEAARSTLQKGDVLMTEGGDPDKLGRGCVWDDEISDCLHQNHVFAVRPQVRLNPYFLTEVLGTVYAQTYFLLSSKQTTNLASTNKTKIGAFRVPLPPLEEQQGILQELTSKVTPIGVAIQRAEREISLLREYQIRLTADVVTGKLDVRSAAAALPDVDPHDPGPAAYDADEEGLDGDDLTEESM
ncbi:restriction endonuclease subunit S [Streptosporangium sp. NPDC087985]|uniref:restriction endonuclease subunit S n=1 Tax=Streptosporangium sp. NPDC087985 TaxID=3366196 RepID=UPI0037FF24CD